MKKRILIIDDCLAILNSLRMMLELFNYDAEITQNGACLFDNKATLPDILLIDYHIPGINDGCSLFEKLKNNPRLNPLPIILMSGDREIERLSSRLNVNHFIAKPFDLNDLLTKIELCSSRHDEININDLKFAALP